MERRNLRKEWNEGNEGTMDGTKEWNKGNEGTKGTEPKATMERNEGTEPKERNQRNGTKGMERHRVVDNGRNQEAERRSAMKQPNE